MTDSSKSSKAPTPSDAAKPDESVEAVKDAGGDQVQEMFDEANARGFFGEKQDDTPRENYTVSGVGSGAPTPETDPEKRMNQPPRSY